MIFYIVIPVHNEEKTIGLTLDSLVSQTIQPQKLVVVNDNSDDNSQNIIDQFVSKYDWINTIKTSSTGAHKPGKKIIDAFYCGFNQLDDNFDVICKFDGDLIFPNNYLESLAEHFRSDGRLGMIGGHCSILKDDKWVLEGVTGGDHIRGALKAYRKDCFEAIGGLKPALGWDTVDELLAEYNGWTYKTDASLIVKHLAPTGSRYTKKTGLLHGQAFYSMRLGMALTILRGIINSYRLKQLNYFWNTIKGYSLAKRNKTVHIVNSDEGNYIRRRQWQQLRKKLTGS